MRACSEGEVSACACGQYTGEQSCLEDGTYDECDCSGDGGAGGTAGDCTEGDMLACECLDGQRGEQTCQASRAFGPCDCAPPDDGAGPMPDAGACTDVTDSDGDGLRDCLETGDENAWTAADVFNGVQVTLFPGCGAGPFAGSCDALLDSQQVDTCTAVAPLESLQQSAGWDFGSADTGDSCSADYGFQPGWDSCADPFQLVAEGFIQLETGRHCFFVSDAFADGCGALYVSREPTETFTDWAGAPSLTLRSTPGGDRACMGLEAGVYPIRWYFNMWGPDHALRLRYCFDRSDDCAAGRAIPSGMLRASGP